MKLLNAIEFVAVVGGDDAIIDTSIDSTETTDAVVADVSLPTLDDMSADMTLVAVDASALVDAPVADATDVAI